MAETKLFVGNLSWDTTKDDLVGLFSKFGPVSDAFIPNDRETGRPRGFGFVTLESSAAQQAVSQLSDTDFMGRSIRVNEAQSKDGGGGGRGGGGFGGGRGGGGYGGGGYGGGGYGQQGGGGYGQQGGGYGQQGGGGGGGYGQQGGGGYGQQGGGYGGGRGGGSGRYGGSGY